MVWGDAASIAYVDSVLSFCSEKPLMVLALARPEVTKLFSGLWSQRGLNSIGLGRLSRKASEKLARQVLREAGTDGRGAAGTAGVCPAATGA